MTSLVDQLAEYKNKIEALAGKAAAAESFETELNAIKTDKLALDASLAEKEGVITGLAEKVAAAEAKAIELEATIASMEADKKASDEKALEIVASLGLKEIPVITIIESKEETAESIRNKYLAISDPVAKGKFFAENRQTILTGIKG